MQSARSWLMVLCVLATLLSLRFIDWPVNRDVSSYATIAAELEHGARLYVDVWDIKPPGIYATYLLAQWTIDDRNLQILVLHLVPSLIVLIALFLAADAAGFGRVGSIVAATFWVLLSGDTGLQMQDPNTELFINACCSAAFLMVLRQSRERSWHHAAVIGVLFAIACLFKTVALAIAVAVAVGCLFVRSSAETAASRVRMLVIMALAGAATLAIVTGYFGLTHRIDELREVTIDASRTYAGDLWGNVNRAFTMSRVLGERRLLLTLSIVVAPWLAFTVVAAWDRTRRRSWLLLAAYTLGALVALGLPGQFYRHYFQLLVPPACLVIAGVAALLLPARLEAVRRAPLLVVIVVGLGLAAFETRVYFGSIDAQLEGTYQDRYLQTQRMARRLSAQLRPDEVLYQWGEDSGVYWYSGRRPPASVLTYPLLRGPQAERLSRQSLASLTAHPPALVVASNYMLDDGVGHPVFEWIRAHYVPALPQRDPERRYFTFFVPSGSSADFVARVGAERSVIAE
jgi:hypothetical protein